MYLVQRADDLLGMARQVAPSLRLGKVLFRKVREGGREGGGMVSNLSQLITIIICLPCPFPLSLIPSFPHSLPPYLHHVHKDKSRLGVPARRLAKVQNPIQARAHY